MSFVELKQEVFCVEIFLYITEWYPAEQVRQGGCVTVMTIERGINLDANSSLGYSTTIKVIWGGYPIKK